MKKIYLTAAAAACLLVQACASSSQTQQVQSNHSLSQASELDQSAQESTVSETPSDSSSAGSSSSKPNDTSNTLNTCSDDLRSLLKSNGWQITDFEQERQEISFDASNNNSWIGVELETVSSNLSAQFNQEARTDDDMKEISRFENETASSVILQDLEDGTYEIIIADQANSLMLQIDDIRSDDLASLQNLLSQMGYPMA